MILFVSQSLGSFVSPTCASKSLSQLGGSHGSLPSTVYCRAGRTNLLLSEFWGIKTFFFGPLSQRTLCEAARTGAAVATVVMRSSDPTYQTVPWTWKLVGMGSPSGSPPPPHPRHGATGILQTHSLLVIEKSSLMLQIRRSLPVTCSHKLLYFSFWALTTSVIKQGCNELFTASSQLEHKSHHSSNCVSLFWGCIPSAWQSAWHILVFSTYMLSKQTHCLKTTDWSERIGKS